MAIRIYLLSRPGDPCHLLGCFGALYGGVISPPNPIKTRVQEQKWIKGPIIHQFAFPLCGGAKDCSLAATPPPQIRKSSTYDHRPSTPQFPLLGETFTKGVVPHFTPGC